MSPTTQRIVIIGPGVPSGTTPVGTTGIAVTQVAYGSGTNTIKGDSALTFTDSTGVLKLGVSGSQANSVSVTGDASGGLTLAAAGTNQSVSLMPTGTGQSTFGPSTLTNSVKIGAAASTPTIGMISFGANMTDSTQTLIAGSNNGTLIVQAGTGASIVLRTNGANASITLDASQGITAAKKIVSYNAIATAGWGIAAVAADGTIAATTNARSAAVASYTLGASDATFVISGNVNVTTSTAHSFSLDCVYTDETNTSRTLVIPMAQLVGSFVASGLITNVTGAGPYESASMTIRCKAATTITIRPSAGGTYTTVVYNANANIRQVS